MRDQAERTDSRLRTEQEPGSGDQADATGFLADIRWLVAACGLLLIGKTWFAWRLDLYSDEIFYWLASTRPALAYSDLPFLTASLAGAGSALDPGNPLATRSLFLIAGSCLPAAVYWMALPWVCRRDAMQAAFLGICLPLGGFLGLLAVPDVPMLLFGLLSLGSLARALRSDATIWWLASGIFLALGLCTHYRFILYPAGAFAFLLFRHGPPGDTHSKSPGGTRPAPVPGRAHWRNPKLWLGGGITALGLLPLAWANFSADLGSASFYFVERHSWQFAAAGLLHLPLQSLLVTPPLYALLLYSAWLTCKSRKSRDTHSKTDAWSTHSGGPSAHLLLWFSLPHLLAYALLAPWADANSTSAHWPLPGYFPLLVFAPQALRRLNVWLRRRWRDAGAKALLRAIPAIGFAGALLAVAGIGSQSWHLRLQPLLGAGVLSEKMAGWGQFSAYTEQVLRDGFSAPPVIVTDNYYTAAQLQYAGVAQNAYTLDHDKAVRDGRYRQLELWRRSGRFVRGRAGEAMLFITEDSTLNVDRKHGLMVRACGLASALEQLDQLSLFAGDKQFSYYRGAAIVPSGSGAAKPCPYPPRAWIDQPAPGAALAGTAEISGWAYNEQLGLAGVRLYLDGEFIAEAEYGLPRPDVVEVRELTGEPGQPNPGFRASIDTAAFTPGRHELAIGLIDIRGFETIYGHREVRFENPRP